jgi:hypothetical protein
MKDAVAYLMTPQRKSGRLLYPNHMEAIETAVKEILPDARFEILPYIPAENGEILELEESKSLLRGSCLVQYKPATAVGGPSYKVIVENEWTEPEWIVT